MAELKASVMHRPGFLRGITSISAAHNDSLSCCVSVPCDHDGIRSTFTQEGTWWQAAECLRFSHGSGVPAAREVSFFSLVQDNPCDFENMEVFPELPQNNFSHTPAARLEPAIRTFVTWIHFSLSSSNTIPSITVPCPIWAQKILKPRLLKMCFLKSYVSCIIQNPLCFFF